MRGSITITTIMDRIDANETTLTEYLASSFSCNELNTLNNTLKKEIIIRQPNADTNTISYDRSETALYISYLSAEELTEIQDTIIDNLAMKQAETDFLKHGSFLEDTSTVSVGMVVA